MSVIWDNVCGMNAMENTPEEHIAQMLNTSFPPRHCE